MKKVELAKIESLNPSRYVLATSARLTPATKDKLVEALQPYLNSPSDIYGLQEIESLLQARPEVVRRHLRLWLNSAAVLQSLLNKKILTRSFDLAEDARRATLVYVPNQSFYRASEIIENKHLCIISGLPGIGKTTLAQVLSVTYANSGYEIFEISEDADEINGVWDDRVAQLFYYDDFLGQTALDDKLNKNEDNRLLRILRRVNQSKNKRMILTTREYILEQARQRYERIGAEDFSPLTAVLSLGDYTDVIRAEILYNHVYFSDLAEYDKALFARPTIYKRIITSAKFNPRLIDYSIRASITRGDHGYAVAQEIFDNLATPRRIWEHIILHQLDSLSVQILVVLFCLRQHVSLDQLTQAIKDYRAQSGNRLNDREFKRSLKVLDGTMVRITSAPSDIMVEYHNPSINDYMREYIFSSGLVLSRLIGSISYPEQLKRLWVYLEMWEAGRATLQRPEIRAAVIEAALRAFKNDTIRVLSEVIITQHYGFESAPTVLEIAERLDSDGLRELIKGWLCSTDMDEAAPLAEDIVALIGAMFKSNSAEITQIAENMLDDALNHITGDTSDWQNARYAKDALETLESHVPARYRDVIKARIKSVEEVIDDYARFLIERVTELGEIPSWGRSYIGEVIEHAKRFHESDDLFLGFSEVQDLVAASQVRAPDVDLSAPSDGDESKAETDKVISRMLGMLREHNR